jgi:glucokinase
MGGELESQPQVVIGVDIGGTNIKVVLVDPTRQRLLERVQMKTQPQRGPRPIVADLRNDISKLGFLAEKRGFKLAGVGVGCAGLIDLVNGVVITSPNLPGWENLPLAQMLSQEFQIPVLVENDVNCICYGEYWLGAGRDLGDFFCIAPGTGVGGCVFINGGAWQEHGYSAGEIGHMTIKPDGEKCRCGNYGCLETLASANWLVRRAEVRLRQGDQSSLRQDLNKPGGLDAERIYHAAIAGDEMARDLFHLVGTSLAIAIANVVHLLGIRSVLISGGVAKGWEAFISSLEGELGRRLTLIQHNEVNLVRTQIGDDAGPLGGAYLAAKSTGVI